MEKTTNLLVMKFGGTSVGTPERIKDVAQLAVNKGERCVLVLSAMAGTTNTLVEISDCYYKKEFEKGNSLANNLRETYVERINKLLTNQEYINEMYDCLNNSITAITYSKSNVFTGFEEKNILAQGEILSTKMMYYHLLEQGINAVWLFAPDYIQTDKYNEPDYKQIENSIVQKIADTNFDIYVIQGFICSNAFGEIDNLKRGGSDYSAAIIGSVLKSKEIQIWTDIDGMHNNDPRIVENTKPIRQLNFEEAAELAYFGAKILHPLCIKPAQKENVPVRLLNTMYPQAEGTLISNITIINAVKAVAAKDKIVGIHININRKDDSDIIKNIFTAFGSWQINIDLASVSQSKMIFAIEDNKHIEDIIEELSSYGEVKINKNMCIVCVVGNFNKEGNNIGAITQKALKDIPLDLISYGASEQSVSFLIEEQYKTVALKNLSNSFF